MTSRSVWLAGFAALLPAAVSASAGEAPPAAAQPVFVPPTSQLVLTRTLVRSLVDGKEVRVARRYAIRFQQTADGYRVDGELIDAEVSAPPVLAALAQLERERPDHGLFPLRVDAAGRLVPRPGAASEPHPAAAAAAQALIGAAALDPADKARAGQMISTLSAAGAVGSAWPVNLFNPGAGYDHSERREIALPGGDVGVVEIRTRVRGLRSDGLPLALEREVVTTLEQTREVSREIWEVSPS